MPRDVSPTFEWQVYIAASNFKVPAVTAEPCTTLLYPLSIKSPAFQNDSFSRSGRFSKGPTVSRYYSSCTRYRRDDLAQLRQEYCAVGGCA